MPTTERLLLRFWRESDRAPFAALNADPVVMEHFPATLTRRQSDEFADRIQAGFAADGFGLWAVEERAAGSFLGLVGLARTTFDAPVTPAVEVGWRLARVAWGRGFASEAARAALAEGFGRHGLAEVVSFTTPANQASQAVMRRIGMRADPAGDFDHPRLPADSPLRRHVLYRISREQWFDLHRADPVPVDASGTQRNYQAGRAPA